MKGIVRFKKSLDRLQILRPEAAKNIKIKDTRVRRDLLAAAGHAEAEVLRLAGAERQQQVNHFVAADHALRYGPPGPVLHLQREGAMVDSGTWLHFQAQDVGRATGRV